MKTVILFVGLLSAPAVAADQFDLVCMFGKTEVRYRVDLARGEACQSVCDRVWKMGAVTSGEIVLLDTMHDYQTEVAQKIVVNRTSGILQHWIGRVRPFTEAATCRSDPFSGFPAAKF
ncbi:MAG: hypothetical protein ACK4TC_04870 [Sphingomonas pseudosanguinis]|uniref:hypothetical protein n=1 Tax=Sphingomonas pseudosanguinis TaxID=413712 RepID=UPI00391D1D91